MSNTKYWTVQVSARLGPIFEKAYILTQINFKIVFDIGCVPEELVINMKSTQKLTVFK